MFEHMVPAGGTFCGDVGNVGTRGMADGILSLEKGF